MISIEVEWRSAALEPKKGTRCTRDSPLSGIYRYYYSTWYTSTLFFPLAYRALGGGGVV